MLIVGYNILNDGKMVESIMNKDTNKQEDIEDSSLKILHSETAHCKEMEEILNLKKDVKNLIKKTLHNFERIKCSIDEVKRY